MISDKNEAEIQEFPTKIPILCFASSTTCLSILWVNFELSTARGEPAVSFLSSFIMNVHSHPINSFWDFSSFSLMELIILQVGIICISGTSVNALVRIYEH